MAHSKNLIQYIFILMIIGLIPAVNLFGQDIRFTNLSIEDGISQSVITSIVQDNQGYIWLGTNDGLNRYDGYNFKVYRHIPGDRQSLSNNAISKLVTDAMGRIWVGTKGGGLNKYDPLTEKWTRYKHNPENSNSISGNIITSLCIDSAGIIWIGTRNTGLNKFDPETDEFSHFRTDRENERSLPKGQISAIYEDSSGILWIGTAEGLFQLNPRTNEIFQFRNNPQYADPLPLGSISSIHEDSRGVLRIGTGKGGLFQLNRDRKAFNSFKMESALSSNIELIEEDSNGDIWIGTFSQGLKRISAENGDEFHYQSGYSSPYNLSGNTVYAFFEDREGLIWIGTDLGVSIYNPGQDMFRNYSHDSEDPNSLLDSDLCSLFIDSEGVVWIGNWNKHLTKFDLSQNRYSVYFPDPSDSESLSPGTAIHSIAEDSEGYLWIAVRGGGLNRFDPETERFLHFRHDPDNAESLSSDQILSVFNDSEGDLWVGTFDAGLNRLDKASGRFQRYMHDGNDPSSIGSNNYLKIIFEDSRGYIWVGSEENGLNRLDKSTGEFVHFNHDPDNSLSLSNDNVISIYEDRAGRLWIGTAEGLNLFHRKSETFTHYLEKDGLPNSVIYAILEDNDIGYGLSGNLWISTNKGISRFDTDSNKFKNYDFKDGLQSNEFNQRVAAKNNRGELFFGGINGFTIFDPEKIRENLHLPEVLITDFKIMYDPVPIGGDSPLQKPISQTESLVLSHNQNTFSFDLTVLSLIDPRKNNYAYMLEGFDTDWIYTYPDRRFALYTNLAPGNYVFRVKGSNNDNIWNSEGASLKITITPPWWKKWWAYLFYFITTALVIFSIIEIRIASVNKTRNELKQLIDSMPSVLIAVNTKEKIIHWNQTAEKILEIKAAEALGNSLLDVLPYMSSEIGRIRESIKSGDTLKESKKLRNTGDGIIYEDVTIFPFITNGVKSAVIRIDDVSELVKMEEIVVQNEKMLSVGGLAAGMAHEINNPLAGIIQNINVLENRLAKNFNMPANRKVSDSLNLSLESVNKFMESRGILHILSAIQESGRRISEIVSNMLDFARQSESDFSSCSVNNLIDKSLTLAGTDYNLKTHYDFRSVKIIKRYDKDITPVPCEGANIQQVLLNILQNGAQAMNAAGTEDPTFIISTYREEKRNSVCIEIKDNGPGIEEKIRRRIFEPFFTTKPRGKGTGLGLSVSYFIITENHNGELLVDSTPGEGTVFTIKLPLDSELP